MAFGTIEFYSVNLARTVRFRFFIPNDVPPLMVRNTPHYGRPSKTLYLLHGFSGASGDWLLSSRVSDYALERNLIVILPDGENSFYLNQGAAGRRYADYIGQELVAYTRKLFSLSDRREDTCIGGLSMGGFGALHTALAFPETFGAVFSLSGALIVHNVKNMTPGFTDMMADYSYYRMTFGEPSQLVDSDNNPEKLLLSLLASDKPLPRIYQAVGTEDFLYGENQILRRFLTDHGVPFTYEEGPGAHTFDFWDPYCRKALDWLVTP